LDTNGARALTERIEKEQRRRQLEAELKAAAPAEVSDLHVVQDGVVRPAPTAADAA
jgi:hypothetical protein